MLSTTGGLNVAVSRRTLLLAGVSVGLAAGLACPALAAPSVERPEIHPRDDWAQGLAPVGSLGVEEPGDVRFLLVHHSDTPNDDRQDRIPGRIRSFFDYHTGTKGWPDVAYNFFIDPYGGLWEGRKGSLRAPVKGDATGGSQGFALLCCFIGNFAKVAPTSEALDAATRLLAWLADSYRIDLSAGHQVSFISRGSNRWPAGSKVVTDPIAGHRDMSQTTCPGDALYPLVRSQLLVGARALTVATPTPTPTPTSAVTQSAVVATALPTAASTTAGEPSSPTASTSSPVGEASPADGLPGWVIASGVGAGVVGAGAIAYGLASSHGPDARGTAPQTGP